MHPLHPTAVRGASAALLALIALCVTWEIWLAPLRPGGSWLVLKTLPLLIPLRGILHGRPYTYRWTSLLVLAYFGEGLVRASSDAAPARWYAAAEVALAVALFVSIVAALRLKPR
jgi:uncharacterized membrane protein